MAKDIVLMKIFNVMFQQMFVFINFVTQPKIAQEICNVEINNVLNNTVLI